MARMIGTFGRPRCPACRTASGPDCDSAWRGKTGQRMYERAQWMRDYWEDEQDFWYLRHNTGWFFLGTYAWMWQDEFDDAYAEFGVTDAGRVRRRP